MTKIQWTEVTWNPIVGCSVESPGCKNCYAMTRVAPRLANNPATPHYHGTVEKTAKGKYVWTGKIGIAPDSKFEEPLRWKKPKMVFVNSVSDLFHPNVPDEIIDRVFAVMALSPKHTFQVLTKHPQRMAEYMATDFRSGYIEGMAQSIYAERTGEDPSLWLAVNLPLPNVWLGTSVEDQTRANERIPYLLDTPAAVRFVSAEPLLEEVRLDKIFIQKQNQMFLGNALAGFSIDRTNIGSKIDWVIVGGESGHGARPMHPDWARSLRDQCQEAGVPYFFKQWGEYRPAITVEEATCYPTLVDGPELPKDVKVMSNCYHLPHQVEGHLDGKEYSSSSCAVFKAGTKAAGRTLDGREWNEMPEVGA